MTYLICIAAWSLNIYQIWTQSAELFLRYSLATNFDTLRAARATYLGAPPPNDPNPIVIKVA